MYDEQTPREYAYSKLVQILDEGIDIAKTQDHPHSKVPPRYRRMMIETWVKERNRFAWKFGLDARID